MALGQGLYCTIRESLRLVPLAAALWFFAALSAQAGEFFIAGGGGSYDVKSLKTLSDSRFRSVIRQRYDFSCGSAALATLLTYHYDQKVAEIDVLKAMFADGDQEKIRREGFSMLDMKNYLGSIGYEAEGFRESLDKLARVGIPAIVLINKKNYMHFVVVKGVTDDKVSVGDPTLGLRIYTRDEFEKMWNGILFVIMDNKPIARTSFNIADSWTSHGNPNFRNMLDQGELSRLTMDASSTPGYY